MTTSSRDKPLRQPDFPWDHVGGQFRAIAALTNFAAELVKWLGDMQPCKCQPLSAYLGEQPLDKLLEMIKDYRSTGNVPTRTCACSNSQSKLSQGAPHDLPSATCRLFPDGGDKAAWPFDIDEPKCTALDWIINRLKEKQAMLEMEKAWVEYQHMEWHPSKAFEPSARFPGTRELYGLRNSSGNLFGPIKSRSLDVETVLVLKRCKLRASNDTSPPSWMSYLDRDVRSHPSSRPMLLTPAVGVMVSEPEFKDAEARSLFASLEGCKVKLLPVDGWENATFARPRGIGDRDPITLRGIRGPTILFLGCYVIGDRQSTDKLLLMRETGSIILHDLLDTDLVGIVEGRLNDLVKKTFAAAMECSADWSLHELCLRLALWFRVWMAEPKIVQLCKQSVQMPLDSLVQMINEVWQPEVGNFRLFAPDTDEGWEDTAEVTAIGVYHGCAVGAVVLAALKKIGKAEDRITSFEKTADLTHEWVTNAIAVLTAVFKAGAALKLDESKKRIVERLNRDLLKANHDEIFHLNKNLRRVRDNLTTVVASYAHRSILDGERLRAAFGQAFTAVVTQDVDVQVTDVIAFFQNDDCKEDLPTLRHGSIQHFDARFSHTIFEDLGSLRLLSYTARDFETIPRLKKCLKSRPSARNDYGLKRVVLQLKRQVEVQKQRQEEQRIAAKSIESTPAASKINAPEPRGDKRSSTPEYAQPPTRVMASLQSFVAFLKTSANSVNLYRVASTLSFATLLLAIWLSYSVASKGAAKLPQSFASWSHVSAGDGVILPVPATMAKVTNSYDVNASRRVLPGDTVELLTVPAKGWYMIKVQGSDEEGVSCTARWGPKHR